MMLHPLLNATLRAVASGPSWQAWTPLDPPLPGTGAEHACVDGDWHWSYRQRGQSREHARQPMCLARDDLISKAIQRRGRWYDCGKFVRLWHELESCC